MKALSNKQIDELEDNEMLICCNCAYVDTKTAHIGRCIGDKEVICPACSSKAFLIFEEESSEFVNSRIDNLYDDAEVEEVEEDKGDD